jgi:hypothetical protein
MELLERTPMTARWQLADANGFRQAAVADDFFSERFLIRAHSKNSG